MYVDKLHSVINKAKYVSDTEPARAQTYRHRQIEINRHVYYTLHIKSCTTTSLSPVSRVK